MSLGFSANTKRVTPFPEHLYKRCFTGLSSGGVVEQTLLHLAMASAGLENMHQILQWHGTNPNIPVISTRGGSKLGKCTEEVHPLRFAMVCTYFETDQSEDDEFDRVWLQKALCLVRVGADPDTRRLAQTPLQRCLYLMCRALSRLFERTKTYLKLDGRPAPLDPNSSSQDSLESGVLYRSSKSPQAESPHNQSGR